MPLKDKDEYNAYMNSYMLSRYKRRMEDIKQQMGGKCSQCGTSEDLHFDHIDPALKSFTIAKMWSLSEKEIQLEIEKCQLLCQVCHKKKHMSRALCGTPQKYWRGCRCEECTNANRVHSREYRKNRRKT